MQTSPMTKLTFRADGDLVERLEALDASKSEVMRDALRSYLDDRPTDPSDTIDEMIAERVDELVADRGRAGGRDVNLTITVEPPAVGRVTEDGRSATASEESYHDDASRLPADRTCNQCGDHVEPEHVHCPNCGEKQARRAFCHCGGELRSDWSFCPECGGKTPAADVLDRS